MKTAYYTEIEVAEDVYMPPQDILEARYKLLVKFVKAVENGTVTNAVAAEVAAMILKRFGKV